MKFSRSLHFLLAAAAGLWAAASQPVQAQAVVFDDTFGSGSSLNSLVPGSPTANSTSYQMISGRTWSASPSLSSGHLTFGIGSTTGGGTEVQALFTSSPVALNTVGDAMELSVTFTDTAGILTDKGLINLGLFSTGQSAPVTGGLNGTGTSAFTDSAMGAAQDWVGYVGQIAFTGNKSQINLRTAQTGAGNNNQDVTTGGSVSSSQGYANPKPTHIYQDTTSGVTLSAGGQYTMVLQYVLTAPNTLAVTNLLYSGADNSGTLLSQFGGEASAADFLASSFDGFGFGWYEQGGSSTAIDINHVVVSDTLQTVPEPSLFTLGVLGMSALAARLRRRIRSQVQL
jgi:hypothetical protein